MVVSLVVVTDTLVIKLVTRCDLVILIEVSQHSTLVLEQWGSYVSVSVVAKVVRSVVRSVVYTVT